MWLYRRRKFALAQGFQCVVCGEHEEDLPERRITGMEGVAFRDSFGYRLGRIWRVQTRIHARFIRLFMEWTDLAIDFIWQRKHCNSLAYAPPTQVTEGAV